MFENIPEELFNREGTISFVVDDKILERTEYPLIVDKIVKNGIEFLLQIEPNSKLVFQHTSANYGIRISRVNLSSLPHGKRYMIFLVWTPERIQLSIGVKGDRSPLLEGDFLKIP